MKLTTGEEKVLRAIINNGLENMGGKKPKDLLEDNFSWFYPNDIAKLTGFSKHEISGYMSSLFEKELILNDDNDDSLAAEWYATDNAIHLIIELDEKSSDNSDNTSTYLTTR